MSSASNPILGPEAGKGGHPLALALNPQEHVEGDRVKAAKRPKGAGLDADSGCAALNQSQRPPWPRTRLD